MLCVCVCACACACVSVYVYVCSVVGWMDVIMCMTLHVV